LGNFIYIQAKLQKFIKKYYVNELIKGLLLFFSIGLLYFIFTLFIEYFLWLKPTARSVLFVLFILVEIGLFVFYIVIPIFKIWGLKKGISNVDASKIIGNHFPEVKDKLLNIIQLDSFDGNSELIEASIEQKSKALKPIPFKNAIDFSNNKKYIKYALIPVLIWLLVFITGNVGKLNNSLSRVVHYNTQFEPPAPFSFKILNPSLNVIEGEPFTLQIETVGNLVPEDAKIYFLNENYYLDNKGFGKFEYTFSGINNSLDFVMQANGVVSKVYQLNSIATPVITHLKMVLNYPTYTGKQNEVIQNSGNALVPLGTHISWQVETHQTEQISFLLPNEPPIYFNQNTENYFSYQSKINTATHYAISTSNSKLQNYERLNFTVQVIPDEFPKIIVRSNIDSVSRGPVQFLGQLSDDYGIKKLQLVYYDKNNPNRVKKLLIKVPFSSFTDFYYVFPEGISIEEGVDYEFYFEVFDNDAINGSKKSKSLKFSYYKKSVQELKEELLKEQKENLSAISKSLEKSKKTHSDIEKFKNELQKKAAIDWNDSKKLDEFLKRQNQYEEMFKEQTMELEQNLKEQPVTKNLEEKKKALQKRIEETKKIAEQQKMLDELHKLAEKLEKESLIEKLQDIAKKNKRKEQSLERILELTKRFYVEQKANQISEKLEKLAEEENKLSKDDSEENNAEKQAKVNEEFEEIKKDFKELDQQNNNLKRPMRLPDSSDERKDIHEDLNEALEELSKEESKEENSTERSKSKAQKSQKKAAKKMMQLSKSMAQSMAEMEGESIDENIDDLRKIVENLIEFSFQQEDLMNSFSESDNNNPEFPKHLKQQYTLKEYFEHIDDSLYVLSLRLVKMGTAIQKEVSDVHYNMDASLSNFIENRFDLGISNQHFVLTGANNLANQLSDLLESLMNASSSIGKGKGSGQDFSLPDIIQKQGELTEKMKEGMKKGEKSGDKEGGKKGEPGESGQNDNDQMNGELYEIYKEQAKLRNALQQFLNNKKGGEKEGAGEAMKQMEDLEKEMLEKGFSKEVIEQMQQLNYVLLKFKKASLEQGEDKERKSDTNSDNFKKRNIDKLKLQNEYFNSNEILNRQSLPLRTIYKKKVQEYFKKEK